MSDSIVQSVSDNATLHPVDTSQTEQQIITPNQPNHQSNDSTITTINAIKTSLESQLNQPESTSTEQPAHIQNNQSILDMLNQLDSFTPSINQSILASTQIGITVNKISKAKPPQSTEVKDKAKSLIATWKTIVAPKSSTPSTNPTSRTISKTDNLSSRTPSPPASAKSSSPVKSAAAGNQTVKQPSSQSATVAPTTPSAAKRKAPTAVDVKTAENDGAAKKRAKIDATPTPTSTKAPTPSTPISSSSSPSNKDSHHSSSGDFRLGKTGNETRNKIQKLLFDSIGGSSGDWEVELACRIEAAMWSQYKDTNAAYKTKYRELAMNLKDAANPDLNDALLAGAWTPEQIVSMSSKDLASQSLKEQREKDAKWEMAAARSDLGKLNGLTDMFRCGKCKERKCTYYQMQTRSADEPMTVFVRCTVCGNRWKC